MKNTIKTGAICTLVLLVSALSAQARGGHNNDNEAWAALGGFIGGVIVSEAIHDHDRNRSTKYQVTYDRSQGQGRHNDGYGKGRGRGHDAHGKDRGRDNHGKCSCGGGHWKVVERRVLVPAQFGWQVNSCGLRNRTFTPAYFDFVKERVWVNGHSQSCRRR
ncbi:hypothetical protein [Cerasicoccus arenae]|nr:hypothetical protein [Cerasicoccus arenae]MBK1858942.1 hypothetical protein [Cerasicoccus arenae]